MSNSYKKDQGLFTKIFPTPKFLRMSSVGLDITDRRVRFLELKHGKNGYIIGKHGDVKISPGAIVSGQIKRPKELKKALSMFVKRYGIEFARVSLPEERAYLVKMEVPDTEGVNLRELISFQLEEYVPVPAQDAVFDYHVIGPSPLRKGYLEVSVSVLSEKEITEYIDIFEDTGLMPVSFEIEAQAISRSIIPYSDMGTYMVLDFGGTRTGIFIVSAGVVRFTSTIDIGSNMITRALEKQFSISAEQADKMKNEKGISNKNSDKEFTEAIMSSISILRDEVNKLFLYWHTHREGGKAGKKIEKIFLTGGGANLKGLSEYLSAGLKTDVSVANPWINVNSFEDYIPNISHSKALGYASVVGLALSDKT